MKAPSLLPSELRTQELHRLITIGRAWLENAPEARPGPKDLLGFTGPVGFVCSTCSGRIIARSCALRQLADIPVWHPATPPACALCGK